MSRTSKYYTLKTTIVRLEFCRWCGADLEHKHTGRPRRFCSDKCRAAHHQAVKRYARRCVDASLAGQPKPPKNYDQPVSFGRYNVDTKGNVTKQEQPQYRGTTNQQEVNK